MKRAFYLLVLIAVFFVSGCDRGSKPALIGSEAPDFTVTDSQKTVRLSEHRGKVVVLNFWATWCPPCVKEMPSLVTLQDRLKDKIEIIGVSMDEDDQAYQNFIKRNNITFLTVRDPKQMTSQLYGTVKFPETYVIDSKGVLRRKFIGPADWSSPEIIEYLEKL